MTEIGETLETHGLTLKAKFKIKDKIKSNKEKLHHKFQMFGSGSINYKP